VFVLICLGWVGLVFSTGCTPSRYVVHLHPLDGFNDGRNEKLALHLVWTTLTTEREIGMISANDWFAGALEKYDQQGIVVRDSVKAGDLREHFFGAGETQGAKAIAVPGDLLGQPVTGFVLFANYRASGSDGVHIVASPKSYWPFSPYKVEVFLGPKEVYTAAEKAAQAKGANQ